MGKMLSSVNHCNDDPCHIDGLVISHSDGPEVGLHQVVQPGICMFVDLGWSTTNPYKYQYQYKMVICVEWVDPT